MLKWHYCVIFCFVPGFVQHFKISHTRLINRTSSGKSTLINAMLGDDVLPTGMGVSSSCLVQIVGCEEAESYLTLPNGKHADVEVNFCNI